MPKYDVTYIFQDGGRGGSVLFPVFYLLKPLYSEGQNLSAKKVGRHISIHGWDITTSVLEKETSGYTNSTSGFDFDHITQFACYFALCCWISSKSDHLLRKYDVISIFQDGGSDRLTVLPVSYLLMSLLSEGGQSLPANHISSTYLNWRLRYNYFRFWKTNVRHFVILLPVLTLDLDHFAVICMLFRISLLNFVHIGALIGNMTSYPFLKMAATSRNAAEWRISYSQRESVSETRIAWARDRFYFYF